MFSKLRSLVRWFKGLFYRGEPVHKQPSDRIPRPKDETIANKYSTMYSLIKLNDSKPYFKESLEWALKQIKKNVIEYKKAQNLTGVPWEVIAAIHYREADCDMSKQILNGQRWDRRTTIVPKRRGPWNSWAEACVDAFKIDPMPKGSVSPGQWLDALERFNGLGYRKMGINSPYIWGCSQYYINGRYVADHKFDRYSVSKRAGCAIILKELGFLSESNSKKI